MRAGDKFFGGAFVEAIRLQTVMSVGTHGFEISNIYLGRVADIRLEHNLGIRRSRPDVRKEQFTLHIAVIRLIHISAIPIPAHDAETIGKFFAFLFAAATPYGISEQSPDFA